MDRVFNYDNKFFRGISMLVDCVIISVCWMLMCIPVFTIGAASAAMYDTVHKAIRRDKGYVWSGFWKSFRENFKPATKAWLIHLLILVVLGGDLYITSQALQAGVSWGMLYIVFLVMEALVAMWVIYTYAYIARFEQTLKLTLKNAALLALANLPKTALIFVVTLAAAIALMYVPILIVILPALAAIFYEFILEKVFRKVMTPEDLAKEQEEDRFDKDL